MFLLNLLDDLKLDVQDAIIEHNIKKNINNYNKTVHKNNIAKVANMDLSGKIGEACRIANEIYTSSDPDDTLEEYYSYLYLLLTDDEMHDFVQKLVNAALVDPDSCMSLLNIFFCKELSEQVFAQFYNENFLIGFNFTIPVESLVEPEYDYSNYENTIEQIEMEQRFTNDESPTEDSSEPETETSSESSTAEEIDSEPVVCEVIDNTTTEEEPVKDVEVKVIETETEQPKLEEPEFVKDDTKDDETKKNMSDKTTHTKTYGIIMDNIDKIDKDAADMAAKVLDKVTEGITSDPEPPKNTKRPTTSRKKR